MKKQFIKIPSLLLVLLLSLPAPSFAVVPLVAIPLWVYGVSAALHVAGAAAGLYYAMRPSSPSSVGSDGKISRPSNAVWIDLSASPAAVKTKDIKAVMTDSKARSLSSKKKSDGTPKYPLANGAYNKSTLNPISSTSQVGDLVSVPNASGIQKVFSISSSSGKWISSVAIDYHYESCCNYYNTSFFSDYRSPYYYHRTDVSTRSTTDLPAVRSATVTESNSVLTGSSSGGSLNSAYQEEFDKMFQDPDYIPTFTDDTTGLPWTPPPSSSIATPEKVSAYNSAASASNDAASSASSAASGALNSANNAVGTAQTNYNNNPTGENKKSLDDAIAARDKLVAEQAEKASKDAQDQLDKTTEGAVSSDGFNADPYGDKSDNDLSLGNRFQTFFNEMKSTAIFSLPQQFLSGIPSSNVSVMTFDGGRYGHHSFDFSSLSALWIALKTVVLVMFAWFSIRIVSLKGGGG